jgi:hypothetical protein
MEKDRQVLFAASSCFAIASECEFFEQDARKTRRPDIGSKVRSVVMRTIRCLYCRSTRIIESHERRRPSFARTHAYPVVCAHTGGDQCAARSVEQSAEARRRWRCGNETLRITFVVGETREGGHVLVRLCFVQVTQSCFFAVRIAHRGRGGASGRARRFRSTLVSRRGTPIAVVLDQTSND